MIAKTLKEVLQNHVGWSNLGTSQTQQSAGSTEDSTAGAFRHSFKVCEYEEPYILKMAPNQNPDFLIISAKDGKSFVDSIGETKPSKKLLLKWCEKNGIIPLQISVKSAKGDYRSNDYQPHPEGLEGDVVYVNFAVKQKKVYLALAKDIAKAAGITVEQIRRDQESIERCRAEMKEIWGKTLAASYAKRAHSMKAVHMNIYSTDEEIERVFRQSSLL